MGELVKALKSLISDIEAMQSPGLYDSNWFGSFSMWAWAYDGNESVHIEWPNLAISLENVKTALAQFEGQS